MERKRRLVNIKEAATYIGLKVSTLYGWVSEKKIPHVKIGDRVLFDIADLDAFIEKSKVKPVKEVYGY